MTSTLQKGSYKMRKFSLMILSLVLVLGFAGLSMAAETQHAAAATMAKGTVGSVDAQAKSFTLKSKAGEETFKVADKATLKAGHKTIGLADLKAGELGAGGLRHRRQRQAGHPGDRARRGDPEERQEESGRCGAVFRFTLLDSQCVWLAVRRGPSPYLVDFPGSALQILSEERRRPLPGILGVLAL